MNRQESGISPFPEQDFWRNEYHFDTPLPPGLVAPFEFEAFVMRPIGCDIPESNTQRIPNCSDLWLTWEHSQAFVLAHLSWLVTALAGAVLSRPGASAAARGSVIHFLETFW